MPWCTGCDRFLSPSTVTAAGDCPRCGATVDPGRARAPAAAPDTPGAVHPATGEHAVGAADAPPGPGRDVAAPPPEVATDEGETPLPVPWHFKLLVGAIALYLGWRAFQGIEWVAGRF